MRLRFRIPFATTVTPHPGGPSYSHGDEAALAAVLAEDDVDGYLAMGVLAPVSEPPSAPAVAADGYSVRETPPPLPPDESTSSDESTG